MRSLGEDERRFLRSIFAPPAKRTNWRLEELIGHDRIRYFAYGRHALAEALRMAGVDSGDAVLMPGFICREVLSSIHANGARVLYYPVDQLLRLGCEQADLPDAKAVIAVDFFGFAQDLNPFRDYCKRTGAVLIEDNAHGLFSRDESGACLGARGDIGVFSIRKTLPAPDGAAIAVNNIAFSSAMTRQIDFDDAMPGSGFRMKRVLRQVSRAIGPWPAQAATAAARYARRLKTGHAIPPSSPQSETMLPGDAAPNRLLIDVMANTDAAAESARRRALYRLVASLLDAERYPPVFPALEDGTVPYGYPFIADAVAGASATLLLRQFGIECFQWPALPDAIAPTAPAHYKSVWMASFLW